MATTINNKPIYRMSSVGYCPRALSAEHLDYPAEPAPDWLERAAEEGKKHEEWIKDVLRTEGYLVGDDQKEVELNFDNFVLLGHIDGAVIDNKEPFEKMLLEIKSMSQYEFDRWIKDKWSGFSSYAAQIACYMKGTGLSEVLYLVKNRSSGYIDRAVLKEPPANFDKIITKLKYVEECVAANTLAEAEYLPDSLQCRRCFYKVLCSSTPKEFKAVSESTLLQACKEWRKWKNLEREAKILKESWEKVFLSQTEVSGQKKWRFDELFINKIEVKESVTYPKAELLKIFTEEQLKSASEIKLPYSFLRINDLREETK